MGVMNKRISLLFILVLFLFSSCKNGRTNEEEVINIQNPILPGYFADPSLVQYDGKFYLYATADPWGTDFLSCWVSDDFQNWTFQRLNWPTKQDCTSPYSNENNVWAPSVIQKGDDFYMYVSVGSEVWCGKAKHPLGPWENALGDTPMIPYDTTRYYHVIDAEAFIDDDGRAYLYWGSGWEWINGRCFAAELNEDMVSFKTAPQEITPTHYFEAPLMLKHENKYYLTYSEGKTIDDSYEIRYAIGDTPLGPFVEASNSPVLTKNDSLQVYGPGHHTAFSFQGKTYFLYHRHRRPFETGTAYRQMCLSEYTFDKEKSEINTIIPFHTQLFPELNTVKRARIIPELVRASSCQSSYFIPENVLDNSYNTRWEAADNDKNSYLLVEFAKNVNVGDLEIRFEYPWEKYFCIVEVSEKDEKEWIKVADYRTEGVEGSPVNISVNRICRNIRITFDEKLQKTKPSVWELFFYEGTVCR